MPRSSSRTRKVRNTFFEYIYKKGAIAKSDRINAAIVGVTTEVVTLKQALSAAEKRAATERTERERHEARVGEVLKELQALMTKHEALELDLKTRESELAAAHGRRIPLARERREGGPASPSRPRA